MTKSKNNIDVAIYPHLFGANDLEEILCLSTLVSNGVIQPENADIQGAREYSDSVVGGCSECPFFNKCLALIINE